MMAQDIAAENGQFRMGFQRILAILCFGISAICLSWELPALKDGNLPMHRNGGQGSWGGFAMAAPITSTNKPMNRAAALMGDTDGFMGSNDEKPAPSSAGSGGAPPAQAFNPELLNFLAPMFDQPLPAYSSGSGSDSVEFGGD